MPPASAPLMAANAAEWGGGEGEGWIAAEAIEVAASAVPASIWFGKRCCCSSDQIRFVLINDN